MVCGDTVHGLDRRTQAQMQARIRHEAGSIGMGAEVSTMNDDQDKTLTESIKAAKGGKMISTCSKRTI